MASKRKVCVLGLGSMGLGVALALLERQFDVSGFDINKQACKSFAEAGGKVGLNPEDAAKGASVVIILVVNEAQVDEVLFGSEGAIGGFGLATVVIQSSTVSPAFAGLCGTRLQQAGFDMIDAPVSGGAAGARAGNLSIMASGAAKAFQAAEDVLEAIAGKVHHLGVEHGVGSTVKTVNQLLAGVHIAVAAEAMAFGVRAGADPKALYEVISGSAGSSWMWNNRVPHILNNDYKPLSAIDIFVKDLAIVLGTGHKLNFPLPLTAAAHQQFIAAAAAGLGREDDSAVFKVFQKLSGVSIDQEKEGK